MIKNDGKNSDNNDEEINDIDDHCERMLSECWSQQKCSKFASKWRSFQPVRRSLLSPFSLFRWAFDLTIGNVNNFIIYDQNMILFYCCHNHRNHNQYSWMKISKKNLLVEFFEPLDRFDRFDFFDLVDFSLPMGDVGLEQHDQDHWRPANIYRQNVEYDFIMLINFDNFER